MCTAESALTRIVCSHVYSRGGGGGGTGALPVQAGIVQRRGGGGGGGEVHRHSTKGG